MAGATITVDGLVIPDDVRTLEGFRAWAASLGQGGPRVHYYGGEVLVEMSPQDWRTHLPVSSDLNAQLGALARRLDIGRYFGQGGWITNPAAALSTEPDGALVLWETFASGAAGLERPAGPGSGSGSGAIELVGRVDMALEVVSRTSERKDTVRLVEAYARAGVPEYWIVDARAVPLRLRILVLGPDEVYAERLPDADGRIASPIWRGCFHLAASTDRAGLPRIDLTYEAAR